MAANTPLIERADIHKSCKALESVVNVFNDYCQAAEALALTQKKLARALKDAVGLKATNELAGNALGAAAALLESLAEVDAKFVKTVDKECEGASNDLKKWFKKLAKEERGHDERINAANAKIRNAGQAYEKKAKKKDRDAAEEHTRYVNLLSVVGPEMSQDKYNHSLFVTQRHTATLYSVTSSIARAADAEWVRACDCVRRFAPIIGRIGECRAYLEGGWTANIPEDKNPGRDEGLASEQAQESPEKVVDEMGVVRTGIVKDASGSAETDSSAHRSSAPTYTSTPSYGSITTPSSSSHQLPLSLPYSPPSAPPSLPSRARAPPPTSYFPAPLERLNTDSVRSIESLSSFPTPPTHFPLPAMTQLPATPSPLSRTPSEVRRASEEGERGGGVDGKAEVVYADSSAKPIGSQSLKTIVMPTEHMMPALTEDDGRSPLTGQSQPSTPTASPMPDDHTNTNNDDAELEKRDTIKVKVVERPESPQQHRRRDSIPVATNEMGMQVQERKISGSVQRTESVTSSSSIVASMRDKWGRGDVPTSAPARERDIPRVPNKVADLASRYTPTNDTNAPPLSPRNTGAGSPTFERARQFSSGSNTQREREDTQGSAGARAQTSPGAPPTNAAATTTTPSEIDLARRRRRIEELEDLERREQAQALRARERDIEMRTMELERERERLRMLGSASPSGSGAGAGVGVVRPRSQHSYSMTNLVAPLRSGDPPPRPVSQYGEPLALTTSPSGSSGTSNPEHAPYCGCQTCSAAHYSTPPSHVQVVAPRQEKEKEKSKGWMRRLSMPVVANAFSSDAKKSNGAYGVGAGIAGGGVIGYGSPVGGMARFEQDSTGGISNVGHARPRKISFGRR